MLLWRMMRRRRRNCRRRLISIWVRVKWFSCILLPGYNGQKLNTGWASLKYLKTYLIEAGSNESGLKRKRIKMMRMMMIVKMINEYNYVIIISKFLMGI